MKVLISLNSLLEKKYRLVEVFFFLAYLIVGLFAFKDYGIPWDDVWDRGYGLSLLNHIMNNDMMAFDHKDKYYGPVFQLILIVGERALNLTKNSRVVYLMRHLATFLLFYLSVFFFNLICKQRFKSWKIALLGSLMLIISPRIFAHSFYNTKDIPFLSVMIVSVYTMIRCLDKKTSSMAFVHALICALLVDIRIAGVIIPFITILFLVLELVKIRKAKTALKKIIKISLVYVMFLIPLIVLFRPILWADPIYHFHEAFQLMSHFSWEGSPLACLYMGKFIDAKSVPWHYIPVWILVTTPIFYIVCFFAGCFFIMKELIRKPITTYIYRRDDLIWLLWFFLPLLSVILLKSVLYDAWRHMFFIYPAFIMIGLVGLTFFIKYVKSKFSVKRYRGIVTIIAIVALFYQLHVLQFMIKYHPFQNVYFNRLAGRNVKEAKSKFELDYWGTSYRQGLEYLLENDKRLLIKIYAKNVPGLNNARMLNSKDRQRLVYIKNIDDADYFIDNYRWHPQDYAYEEYYSIVVDQAKIMSLLRVNKK